MTNPYRQLPSISELLERPDLAEIRASHSHDGVTAALRIELDELRKRIAAGQSIDDDLNSIGCRVRLLLERESLPSLRPVINATGIVLHTNLGRSPMHESAARAAYDAARGYLNLELDLDTGKRSSRQDPIRDGICRLTGAEAATAVNNCAAATVIALRTLAAGKDVIVSRGQLIEIGGSFRIPDILQVSGATLREVGTTNITRAADYEKAIGPNTGAILRVHASNYRIQGFTKAATIEELVAIGRRHGVPVIDDVGSGAAVDLDALGFPGEPNIGDGIRAGADLVLFSGDKLLGGPQAGLIAGKKTWIEKIEKDPLMRAFRLDKMTLAALEATLKLYHDPMRALSELPTLKMLSMPLDALMGRSASFAKRLCAIEELESVTVIEDEAFVGGGSLPEQAMPTAIVAVVAKDVSDAEFAKRLRTGRPAVMGRIQSGQIWLDLRTVFERDEDNLFNAVRSAVRGSP